jgi:hypothetical protein
MNIFLRTIITAVSLVAATVATQGCTSTTDQTDDAVGTTDQALLNWPRGSYRQSCDSCGVQSSGPHSVLSCNCRNEYGGWVQTSIEYHFCNSAVANINGVLECDNWPGPRGSFSQSCPYASASGNFVTANCYDIAGNLQWSSIDVSQCAGHSLTNYNGQLICGG